MASLDDQVQLEIHPLIILLGINWQKISNVKFLYALEFLDSPDSVFLPIKRVKFPTPYVHSYGPADGLVSILAIESIQGLVQRDLFFGIFKQVDLIMPMHQPAKANTDQTNQ